MQGRSTCFRNCGLKGDIVEPKLLADLHFDQLKRRMKQAGMAAVDYADAELWVMSQIVVMDAARQAV